MAIPAWTLRATRGTPIGVVSNGRYDKGMNTVATKPLKRVRWTVKEYFKISETGVFDDRRVELINGEIVEMPAQAHPHRTSLSKTNSALVSAFEQKQYWVVVQGTLLLPPYGAPDPDFHVFDVPTGTPDKALPHP